MLVRTDQPSGEIFIRGGGGSKRYKMYFREIGTKQNVTCYSPMDRDSLDSPGSVPGGTSTAEIRSHS